MDRKIKLNYPTSWKHHRSGWGYVSKAIKENLHSSNGITMIDWADAAFRDNLRIEKPWIGILHNPISYPKKDYPHKYQSGLIPLDQLVKTDIWKTNMKKCLGMFTLCQHSAEFIKPFVSTESILHPTEEPQLKFSWSEFVANQNKKILLIGQWMRRYHSICEIKTTLKKTALVSGNAWNKDFDAMKQYANCDGVEIRKHVSNIEFDKLLSKNIVFLDLYDAGACNTVIECIVRNTPLIINRLPANEEYLGKDYPGFFDNLEEVKSLLTNEKLKNIHKYLTLKDKSNLTVKQFIRNIQTSAIYQSLPMVKMI